MTEPLANIEIRIDSFPSDKELGALWRHACNHKEPVRFQKTLRTCLVHLTAHHSSKLVGFVKVAGDGDAHAFLLDPTVNPEFRRNGLGTQLVQAAAAEAKNRGAKYLHVDFEPHLKAFYENCGFTPTEAGLLRL